MLTNICPSRAWLVTIPSLIMLFTGIFELFSATLVSSIILKEDQPFFAFIIFQDNLSMKYLSMSVMFTLKMVAKFPAIILAGLLNNIFGCQYVMTIGMLVYSLTMLFYMNGFLIAGRLSEGLASGLAVTSAYCFISTTTSNNLLKSINFSVVNFSYFCGLSLGAALGSLMINKASISDAFMTLAPLQVLISVLTVLAIIFLKNHNDIAQPESQVHVLEEPTKHSANCSCLKQFLSNPSLLLAIIGAGFGNGTLGFLTFDLMRWLNGTDKQRIRFDVFIWILGGLSYGLAQMISITTKLYYKNISYVLPVLGMLGIGVSYVVLPFHECWSIYLIEVTVIFFGIGLIEYFFIPSVGIICESLHFRRSPILATGIVSVSLTLTYIGSTILVALLNIYFGLLCTCIIFGSLVLLYIPLSTISIRYVRQCSKEIIYSIKTIEEVEENVVPY